MKKLLNRYLQYYSSKNQIYCGSMGNLILNWLHAKDLRIYTSQYDANLIEKEFSETRQKITFHAYWNGEFTEKQAFSIKSFLATQNLSFYELCLWLDETNGYEVYQSNPLITQFEGRIRIKPFNFKKEIEGTPFEKIRAFILGQKDLPAKGDDFRIITLTKYGGVYFDLDIMFLQDMTPLLLKHEFVYAWETQPYANSALFYLRKGSFLANYIAKKFIKRKAAMPWVLFDYKDTKLGNLFCYPCHFFDPAWMGIAGKGETFLHSFEDFFTADKSQYSIHSYREFFPHAYTYHWHNCWKTPVNENSLYALFNKEFDRIIDNRFSDL